MLIRRGPPLGRPHDPGFALFLARELGRAGAARRDLCSTRSTAATAPALPCQVERGGAAFAGWRSSGSRGSSRGAALGDPRLHARRRASSTRSSTAPSGNAFFVEELVARCATARARAASVAARRAYVVWRCSPSGAAAAAGCGRGRSVGHARLLAEVTSAVPPQLYRALREALDASRARPAARPPLRVPARADPGRRLRGPAAG